MAFPQEGIALSCHPAKPSNRTSGNGIFPSFPQNNYHGWVGPCLLLLLRVRVQPRNQDASDRYLRLHLLGDLRILFSPFFLGLGLFAVAYNIIPITIFIRMCSSTRFPKPPQQFSSRICVVQPILVTVSIYQHHYRIPKPTTTCMVSTSVGSQLDRQLSRDRGNWRLFRSPTWEPSCPAVVCTANSRIPRLACVLTLRLLSFVQEDSFAA